jgi:hypothetical protein
MRAIEHEGDFWLVPGWIESDVEEYIAPERMISLKGLSYQDLRKRPNRPADFVVQTPIPKSVFESHVSPEEVEKYTILMRPPLRFQKLPGVYVRRQKE